MLNGPFPPVLVLVLLTIVMSIVFAAVEIMSLP